MAAGSKRTTSIVDISEIEDDDEVAALQLQTTTMASQANDLQQHLGHNQHQKRSQSRSPAAQLYLYHEDLQPQQRISSVLSSMSNLQPPSMEPTTRSADTSPGQTLARPVSGGLPAIDYHPEGRYSPAARSLGGGGGGAGPGQHDGLYAQSTSINCTGNNAASTALLHLHNNGGGTSQKAAGDGEQQMGAELGGKDQEQAQKANLGTLTGVYFPCVQNIFGVILFIRMVWIVGTAGVPTAFALVFICCCVTFTTSISLSAIATNGIVPAGGSYFMISRSLGPECGGAVGTLFFLGTTVAGAMYITGAVEIMLNYMAPSWGLFGDFQRDVSIMYHNIRVYGTLLLIIVGLMVWIGVKFVSKLAPVALFCVLFSIFSVYTGIFINHNGRQDLMLCVVGERLVTLKGLPYREQSFSDQFGASEPFQSGESAMQSRANQTAAKSAEELAQYELRRTRALCTYEKLRYIFCPEVRPAASGAARSKADRQEGGQEGQGADLMQEHADQMAGLDERQSHNQLAELFKRPPNMSNCDPYFKQNRERIHLERAVPGLSSGIFFRNLKPRFRSKGTIVSYDDGQPSSSSNGEPSSDYNFVFVDITTTFTVLISIYFPSCTGILAGSNRSGDLADAQQSIPRGTISAQLTTSFVYLSSILLFGATFNNLFIRDKFGESMGGQLAVTQIAWPEPYFILVGGLLSTLGASLQSLVGAPRILQGIARDDVIPCFHRFAKLSPRGEPETAILFTLAIAELAVLIGNLDFIAPILTISLVMCYFFINLACTLHSLLGSPNWRPRFRHYHWSISLLGCLLCLFVMIVSSWLYFLVAILLAACIYKYIEFCGAKKEWGDGKQGLALSAATYNLLRLKTSEPHTKNWRPQLLLFCKLKPAVELEPPFSKAQQLVQLHSATAAICPGPAGAASAGGQPSQVGAGGASGQLAGFGDELVLAHPKLLTFASQLKAGKGLTLVSSIIEGDYKLTAQVAQRARQTLQADVQRERVRGFADVLVADSIQAGLAYQIQTAGLGGLKHNTVIVGWPEHWRKPIVPLKPHHLLKQTDSTEAQAGPATTGPKRPSLRQHASAAAAAVSANKTRAHLFIDLMRNVQVSQNALLVVKGVDYWPESCDKLGGSIDVWWIVNDGGLLMLLPHLLRQHRTWKACQLRIFTVAQASDNPDQMRADLTKFLYHLRIEAKVDIVVMRDTEISDYAYERTLMMEQRGEIFRRLNTNRKQSILLEQEVDGRLISFRIRKPSIYDFEETIPFVSGHQQQQQIPMVELGGPEGAPGGSRELATATEATEATPTGHHHEQQQQQQAIQSPTSGRPPSSPGQAQQQSNQAGLSDGVNFLANLRPDEANVRRMHTALSLNELILKRSKAAKLVIINLPGAPKESTPEAENNYMEFIEVLTDKLERVLLVQNGGREVITIHS